MSIEFKLPDLGEGIHEAEILAVKVSVGELVKEDQPILEVETDKAVVEIPSPVEGKIERILVKEGDIVTVGSVMITFVETSTTAPLAAAKEKGSKEVSKHVASVATQAKQKIESTPMEVPSSWPVPATPATRRLAREMGIELRLLSGSGPGGRILKEDVRSYAEGIVSSTNKQTKEPAKRAFQAGARDTATEKAEPFVTAPLTGQPVELPDFTKYGAVERVPLRSIRRKIALNMAQSWAHIPHVTHCDEADVTQLDDFLKKNEKRILERGARMTLTVFMVKAVVSGLRTYGQFNASLDESTGEIVYKNYYNIGIAVATERGLIVPVIRNADQKNLNEIAAELADIAKKTREGKIELDRLQGGTFTITNVGAIGGTNMVPMVNFPESAILGMARASQKPVVRKGNIEVGTILPLSLSFDHRIADGAEAAYFVRHVANCLEEPLHLLLED